MFKQGACGQESCKLPRSLIRAAVVVYAAAFLFVLAAWVKWFLLLQQYCQILFLLGY